MDEITLTIPDEYHILRTATFKNECPYDGTKLIKTGTQNGCFDGEHGAADRFTCEKNCLIQYVHIWQNNQGVKNYARKAAA